MKNTHKPDAEMQIIRRTMRDLAEISTSGRRRVMAYLYSRVETLPPSAIEKNGEQQLDIEEAT